MLVKQSAAHNLGDSCRETKTQLRLKAPVKAPLLFPG